MTTTDYAAMSDEDLERRPAELMGWSPKKDVLGQVYVYRNPDGNIAARLPRVITDANDLREFEEWAYRTYRIRLDVMQEEDGGFQAAAGGLDEEWFNASAPTKGRAIVIAILRALDALIGAKP